MKAFGKLLLAAIAIFVLLQFIHPAIPSPPVTAEIAAPPQVLHVLQKDCYSCHSNERRLAWFDQIEPGYWLVRKDVLTAREHLNFSTLGSKPAAVQKATLFEAVAMMQLGAMPLPRFTALHPDAKVTPEDLAILKAYLAPWSTAPPASTAITPVPATSPVNLAAIAPELNGVPFDKDFETWKPLSYTDRGDNDTFRFILGNDIAFKAAQSGNISPWPDGSRFAKIAWAQETGPDGLIHPGRFIQVELMLKDASLYKDTAGWGWGRWRGLDLKPYGKDAHFVGECTTCHLPVRKADDVYTLPITTSHGMLQEVVNNRAAALPANLPYQPLAWNAITMFVDPATRTQSTLYGNAQALQAANPRSGNATPTYPAGAVLALVTWVQRDDPHWFGARIPDAPRSVEFIEVTSDAAGKYRRYDGASLAEDAVFPNAAQRKTFILGLTPAKLP